MPSLLLTASLNPITLQNPSKSPLSYETSLETQKHMIIHMKPVT